MGNKLTKQEHDQLTNILDRYNASDVIEAGELLVELATNTYHDFLINQPQAVAVLTRENNKALNEFVRDLGRINELLYNLNYAHYLLPLADLLNDIYKFTTNELSSGLETEV